MTQSLIDVDQQKEQPIKILDEGTYIILSQWNCLLWSHDLVPPSSQNQNKPRLTGIEAS